MENAKLWALSNRDLIKTGVMLVGSSIVSILINTLQNGTNIDWKVIGTTALVTALTYLLKQFSTDKDGKLGGKI